MHSSTWMAVLREIPAAHHNQLTLTTSSGSELALQSIMMMEDDYLLIRGRLTGVTEGGSYFIVPFDRITYITFNKHITDSDIRSIFGDSIPPAPAKETPPEQEAVEITPVAAPAETGTAPPPPAPAVNSNAVSVRPVPANGNVVKTPVTADKATLLERLRARRSGTARQKPPGQ